MAQRMAAAPTPAPLVSAATRTASIWQRNDPRRARPGRSDSWNDPTIVSESSTMTARSSPGSASMRANAAR